MPRVPSFTAKEIVAILEKHGFYFRRSSGSHFIYFNSSSKRRVTVPLHNRDIPKGTLFSILKQAGLSWKNL